MEILYIFFALLTLHYTYFIGSIFVGLRKLDKANKNFKSINKAKQDFVTVVIPFRNEADVLVRNLKSLEQLNYPSSQFEVIFIDDHSVDNSCEILKQHIKNENIRVVQLKDGLIQAANKKSALEYGINLAKGEIIFASDADCTYNPNWIATMLKYLTEETGFVAGPVDFEKSNSVLSSAQQIEHAGLILTGAGLIGINNPIICSGANIAFRKKVFEKVGGYSGYTDLASGDDSFLMTKIFYESEFKVRFCYDNSAMVTTRANKNIDEFLNQRKRWVGKAFFYKKKSILLQVILLALFLIALPIQFILGLFINSKWLYFFASGLFLKILVEFFVMNIGTKVLYDRKIMKSFPVAELLHIPYTVFTVLLSTFSKFNWKGRELKK